MIQVIKYKCCGKPFAVCWEPECYTDKDWLKGLKKYVNIGHKVETVKPEGITLEKCTCQTEIKY
jgi:hypothetical protein